MHNGLRSWILPITVALTSVLTIWAILLASRAIAHGFSIIVYLLANLVFFLDFFDFGLRLHFRRINAMHLGAEHIASAMALSDAADDTSRQKRLLLRPYAVIVSVHNLEDDLEIFLESMAAYQNRTWIVDDGSTDTTLMRIRQAGWRCVNGGRNRKKPGAIAALLKELPPEIETVLVLDPDSTIRNSQAHQLSDLETVIFDFQRSGMAALCPRIAIQRDGLLARFQSLEYAMAFSLGRKSLGDHSITSGIAIYRRSALASALKQHSLSVYAEDLENSFILLGRGECICYDDRLVVETEGKREWRTWFSQRVGWAYGLLRVYVTYFGELRRITRRRLSAYYQFLIYLGGISLLLQPFKLLAFVLLAASFARGMDSLLGLGWIPAWRIADPVYFMAALVKYTLLCLLALLFAVPKGERAYLVPVVPLYFFYALAQILPTSVGYANWFTLGHWGRRLVRDHYQDEASLVKDHNGGQAAATAGA